MEQYKCARNTNTICMLHIKQIKHCNAFWKGSSFAIGEHFKMIQCHTVWQKCFTILYWLKCRGFVLAEVWIGCQGSPCEGHVRRQWATDATDGRANATSYWARLAIRDSCGQHLQLVEVSFSVSSKIISVVSE